MLVFGLGLGPGILRRTSLLIVGKSPRLDRIKPYQSQRSYPENLGRRIGIPAPRMNDASSFGPRLNLHNAPSTADRPCMVLPPHLVRARLRRVRVGMNCGSSRMTRCSPLRRGSRTMSGLFLVPPEGDRLLVPLPGEFDTGAVGGTAAAERVGDVFGGFVLPDERDGPDAAALEIRYGRSRSAS